MYQCVVGMGILRYVFMCAYVYVCVSIYIDSTNHPHHLDTWHYTKHTLPWLSYHINNTLLTHYCLFGLEWVSTFPPLCRQHCHLNLSIHPCDHLCSSSPIPHPLLTYCSHIPHLVPPPSRPLPLLVLPPSCPLPLLVMLFIRPGSIHLFFSPHRLVAVRPLRCSSPLGTTESVGAYDESSQWNDARLALYHTYLYTP